MDKYNVWEKAADLWEKEDLPEFEVKGYLDGKNKTWTVPEVLKLAAQRIRKMKKETTKEHLENLREKQLKH